MAKHDRDWLEPCGLGYFAVNRLCIQFVRIAEHCEVLASTAGYPHDNLSLVASSGRETGEMLCKDSARVTCNLLGKSTMI